MPRKLHSFILPGPAGALECLLEEPEGGAPREACVVCHPHPLYGGTMHNKVVHRMARGLRRSGAVVLRFNFRGVGKSEGEHDHGIGEIDDARAAIGFLRERYPALPWSLAGFSFGSRAILKLGCAMPGAVRLLAAGFPTRTTMPPDVGHCPAPKVFIQSTRDQYGPRQDLEAFVAALADPKRLIWVEAQDHFFAGALEQFEEAVHGLGLAAGS